MSKKITPRQALEQNTRVWYRRFDMEAIPVSDDIENKIASFCKSIGIAPLALDSRFTAMLVVTVNLARNLDVADKKDIYRVAATAYMVAYRPSEDSMCHLKHVNLETRGITKLLQLSLIAAARRSKDYEHNAMVAAAQGGTQAEFINTLTHHVLTKVKRA